jgi:hypothetical protein
MELSGRALLDSWENEVFLRLMPQFSRSLQELEFRTPVLSAKLPSVISLRSNTLLQCLR